MEPINPAPSTNLCQEPCIFCGTSPASLYRVHRRLNKIPTCYQCQVLSSTSNSIRSSDQGQEHSQRVLNFVRDFYTNEGREGRNPPTFYQVIDALNEADIRTITGRPWAYQNFNVFMSTHGFGRQDREIAWDLGYNEWRATHINHSTAPTFPGASQVAYAPKNLSRKPQNFSSAPEGPNTEPTFNTETELEALVPDDEAAA